MARIGIIGVGVWGSNHAKVLSSLNSLCCVYDQDLQRAKSIAERYSVIYMKSIDELLESNVDGIVLVTPATTHAIIAVKILKAGKGVLIEKPLSVTMEQAMDIKNYISKGARLAMGYEERFNPAVISLINCLKDKDNLSISLYRVGNRPERIKDVGVVLDTMIHDINIANHILGSLQVSYAWGRRDINGKEIFVTAALKGKTGTAHLVASWASMEKMRMGIGVSSDAIITFDLIKQESRCTFEGKETAFASANKVDLLKAEDEAFIKYLNGEGEFPVGIDDAVKDLSIALEILNKMEASDN